jgi:hypothetical protein
VGGNVEEEREGVKFQRRYGPRRQDFDATVIFSSKLFFIN